MAPLVVVLDEGWQGEAVDVPVVGPPGQGGVAPVEEAEYVQKRLDARG